MNPINTYVDAHEITIRVDVPNCIGCNTRVWNTSGRTDNWGRIPFQDALKMLLCDMCKSTLAAFRYLCNTECSCGPNRRATYGEDLSAPHLPACPKFRTSG